VIKEWKRGRWAYVRESKKREGESERKIGREGDEEREEEKAWGRKRGGEKEEKGEGEREAKRYCVSVSGQSMREREGEREREREREKERRREGEGRKCLYVCVCVCEREREREWEKERLLSWCCGHMFEKRINKPSSSHIFGAKITPFFGQTVSLLRTIFSTKLKWSSFWKERVNVFIRLAPGFNSVIRSIIINN
jgi:hypothetical protein